MIKGPYRIPVQTQRPQKVQLFATGIFFLFLNIFYYFPFPALYVGFIRCYIGWDGLTSIKKSVIFFGLFKCSHYILSKISFEASRFLNPFLEDNKYHFLMIKQNMVPNIYNSRSSSRSLPWHFLCFERMSKQITQKVTIMRIIYSMLFSMFDILKNSSNGRQNFFVKSMNTRYSFLTNSQGF